MTTGDSDYHRIKAKLLRERRLFEDPDFPASARAINNDGRASSFIRWKRPSELTRSPKFISGGLSRFDIHQGKLGDCWFIAAASGMAMTNPKLFERVIPLDQHFDRDYAGIFQFWFWQFDTWVEVVVDDRLPTLNGEPWYAHNRTRGEYHEFWPALFEKAYAKLYGSYENIAGGHINDALVDFTGGISETFDLTNQSSLPDNMFELMTKMMAMSSMCGCSIEKKTNVEGEVDLKNGLYAGHAYSINKITQVPHGGQTLRLLRIRNPWGSSEWNGRWGDRSSQWLQVSDADKKKLGLVPKNDGEFWMQYEDWVKEFENLNMCHLYPDALTKEIASDMKRKTWDVVKHHNSWMKGFNAGGCGNSPYEALFWTNPQYRITVTKDDDSDRDGRCTSIVSLMQKSEDMSNDLFVGFALYQLKSGAPVLMNGRNYDARYLQLSKRPETFSNIREVSAHYFLPPGSYVVIPSTFYPNKEGEFYLRIFTEKPSDFGELDEDTSISEPGGTSDPLQGAFERYSGGEGSMDAFELQKLLNDLFRGDVTAGFGIESARSFLAMMDRNQSGVLNYDEFKKMMKELAVWKNAFKTFDKDHSGNIDTNELSEVFNAIGSSEQSFSLSRTVVSSIVKRYGGKKRHLGLEDFLHCCSRVVVLYGVFVKKSDGGIKGKVEMELNEWLKVTMLY